MLNKNIKRISSLCIAIMMCVAGVVSANATESTSSAEEVFPAEQVKELQEKAESQPVYAGKDENGNLLISRTRMASETEVTGTYPTEKGTILVTYDGIAGHAAIVYDQTHVVESISSGVILGNNDWYNTRTTCTGVVVNDTTSEQDRMAADWCYKQIGKPYNYNFFNTSTRDKFYCSQLVWAAFYENYGIDLNTDAFNSSLLGGNPIHPAELVSSEKTSIVYKQ